MSKQEFNMVGVRLVSERKLYSEKEIKKSEDVLEIMQRELGNFDREVFCVLHINTKGQVLSASITSIGEVNSTLVHPREVFKSAILSSASAIMLLHNHPSGSLTASKEDISTTECLVMCGRLMKIGVVDHIICSSKGYISMRNNGYGHLFEKCEDVIAKLEVEDEPEIELLQNEKDIYSSFKLRRKINGHEVELALTDEELVKAFMEQEHLWDVSYVSDVLTEIQDIPEKRKDFFETYGLAVDSFVKSDKLISRLAAGMRRVADKQGISDFEALEQEICKEAARLQRKREKEFER